MKLLISMFTIILSIATIIYLSAVFLNSAKPSNDVKAPISLLRQHSNRSNRIVQTILRQPLVPNIVHFVLFRIHHISFIHFIAIKSVQLNHRPEKILIHCDCDHLEGEYWSRLNKSYIFVVRMEEPKTIFGKQLGNVYHASDIARIQVLMKYGGIYFDTDVFVVKPLNQFFKYEMSIGWPIGQNIGNQVIVANRNARFLKLWLNSYKQYNSSLWYYNAGELPTTSILVPNPGLVHRVTDAFGVTCCGLVPYLFVENIDESEWRDKFYSFHLFYNWLWQLIPKGPQKVTEEDIWTMNTTFGQMARSVLLN